MLPSYYKIKILVKCRVLSTLYAGPQRVIYPTDDHYPSIRLIQSSIMLVCLLVNIFLTTILHQSSPNFTTILCTSGLKNNNFWVSRSKAKIVFFFFFFFALTPVGIMVALTSNFVFQFHFPDSNILAFIFKSLCISFFGCELLTMRSR